MTSETSSHPNLSRRVPCGDSGVGPVAAMRYVWFGGKMLSLRGRTM